MEDGVEPRYRQPGPPMSGFDPAWHPQPATLRAIPPQQPQYGASPWGHPGRPFPQGGPMPQGAGPLISWRPPASRQPSRGPQGLFVLVGLLVPVLLIIGVAAVVNRSPRDVTGPEVTWPPEVQVTRTIEARATQTSETGPPTPEPTISFPRWRCRRFPAGFRHTTGRNCRPPATRSPTNWWPTRSTRRTIPSGTVLLHRRGSGIANSTPPTTRP